MKNIQRSIAGAVVLAAVAVVAYTVGKSIGSKNNETKLINNYSFVKNIIELAGLQVSGVTTFKSTNADSSGSIWSTLKNALAENTATLTVPYTAKYGVAMGDSGLQINVQDSVVEISLQPPQLLSFELHMDRMETTSKKGLLVFEDDEYFNAFQKRLYADARGQLESNSNYLQQSAKRIETILTQYYLPLDKKVRCRFE